MTEASQNYTMLMEIFPNAVKSVDPYEASASRSQTDYLEVVSLGTEITPFKNGIVESLTQNVGKQPNLNKRWRFAVAPHTIEFTENLIEWFDYAFDHITDDGVLGLVIKHTKYPSGVGISISSVEDILAPWIGNNPINHTTSSIASILDDTLEKESLNVTSNDRDIEFDSIAKVKERFLVNLAELDRSKITKSPLWQFTPASFLSIIESLSRLGLFKFYLEGISLDKPDDDNFVVHLKRASNKAKVLASISKSRDTLESSLSYLLDQEKQKSHELNYSLLNHFAQARLIQLTSLQARHDELNGELAAAKLEIDSLQHKLSSIEAVARSVQHGSMM